MGANGSISPELSQKFQSAAPIGGANEPNRAGEIGGGKAGGGLQPQSFQQPIGLPSQSYGQQTPYGGQQAYGQTPYGGQQQSPFSQGFGGAQSFQSPGFMAPPTQFQPPNIKIPPLGGVSSSASRKPKKPAPDFTSGSAYMREQQRMDDDSQGE
jgi:hypothetical protein